MLILITLLIVSTASHRVTESIEDLPPDAFNTTTLFPVGNKTGAGDSKEGDEKPKVSADAMVWKLEAAFGESNLDEKGANQDEKETKPTAAPAPENKTRNTSNEFRPSPHLGTFFDDDSLDIIPTRATVGDFRPLKKPASGFISFPKDTFKSSFYNTPKEINQNKFPYKIEPSIFTRAKPAYRPFDSLDSKPTMESPMRLPAGGLYKSPEAFKAKPVSDEDFGLNFDDLKDSNVDVKQRVNPWKNLLHLMTALIPVGLIVSALTPNIINVHPTGPDNGYPTLPYRRSDSGLSSLSPISEPCRRRLLCELHNDKNYQQDSQSGRVRRRHCHRLHCAEPEALERTLRWLLSHKTATDNRRQHFT